MDGSASKSEHANCSCSFNAQEKMTLKWQTNTASDPFSGHGYSGNDGFSGTKTPDDAILFTVSGITVLVELFWKILMWI